MIAHAETDLHMRVVKRESVRALRCLFPSDDEAMGAIWFLTRLCLGHPDNLVNRTVVRSKKCSTKVVHMITSEYCELTWQHDPQTGLDWVGTWVPATIPPE